MRMRTPRDWTTEDEERWRYVTAELRLLYERVRFAGEPAPDAELLNHLRMTYDERVAELSRLWPAGAKHIKRFDDIGATPPNRRVAGVVAAWIIPAIGFYGLCGFGVISVGGWVGALCIGLITAILLGVGAAERRRKVTGRPRTR